MALYKAVFIDMDGTLLNSRSKISERNIACLKKLSAKGIRAIIATGRPIESIRQVVGPFHSQDPAISLSGSMIHESVFGQPWEAIDMPMETVRDILMACRCLEGVGNVLLDEADGFYALEHNALMEEFIGMYNKHPRLFTYDQIPTAPVLSLLIHFKDHRREIFRKLHESFADRAHFTYFREYPWIELSSVHANKGNAMAAVCRRLGIDIREAVAIGDGANDLEMIARAGLGIAMANADDEVKAVADRLAPDHNHDGFAEAMDEIFELD
jgi:Cof subfamily protein (haloacid dehalogenase superfamily)